MKTALISISYQIAKEMLLEDTNPLCSELSNQLLGFVRARNYAALAECTSLTEGPEYHTGPEFAYLRQLEALFKKNKDFTSDSLCRENAKLSFERAERLCRIANKRLDWYYVHRDRLDPDMDLYLSRMERTIGDALGNFKQFLDEIPELIRVTSGATEDRPRSRSLPFLKISGKIRAPRTCWPLLSSLGTYFGFNDLRFVDVPCNRVTLVPKSWKTHRTIACEPTGSLPLQLCFDSYVKKVLQRKFGINLADQTTNQELSHRGSLFGHLATIDLSMASDTLCFNAVAWLLPCDWLEYLLSVRSREYRGIFGKGRYAKFSSMGNGATFPLETLIFAAACRAVGSRLSSVYGDDIIVETGAVPELVRLLNFLGFRVNEEKSFITGPFRESCGTDWWEGENITPFFLKQTPRHNSEWCHLINGLIRIGTPEGRIWNLCRRLIQEKGLPFVPFIEETMAGVWIDPREAYRSKLIRSTCGIPVLRGCYKAVASKRKNSGRRSLFLWFLQERPEDVVFSNYQLPESYIRVHDKRITSEVATGFERWRYTRNKFVYNPPLVQVPTYLHCWSDYISDIARASRPTRKGGIGSSGRRGIPGGQAQKARRKKVTAPKAVDNIG